METYVHDMDLTMGPSSEFSKAHIYQTPQRSPPLSNYLAPVFHTFNDDAAELFNNLSVEMREAEVFRLRRNVN